MKIITIKENRDFRRIYSRGKSYVSTTLVTYVFKNHKTNDVRVGITTSKKIGKAVQRNRARRVIMAAYREIYPQINEGYDFIFVARGKTPFLKSTDVLRCMEKQLKKAGVLK